MSHVTAIVVVRNGAHELAHTLEAIAAQSRRPDALVIVDCASRDGSVAIAAAAQPTQMVRSEQRLSFGDAVAAAIRTLTPGGADEALWLLPHDAAPEPGALAALVGELEVSPSVGIAGPKLVRWDNPDYFVEYGESMSRTGTTVPLVHDELDQGQHDALRDVLAVAPAGMLVRRRVWVELAGFDPSLPIVDDALDFCVRARLAGYRVSVAPRARVRFAGGGVAGASESEKWRNRITRARLRRTAQLHRRMAYAPSAALLWHWLSLVPLALVRSAWLLIMKTPSHIAGEFRAALSVAFSGPAIARSRRLRKHSHTQPWSVLRALRIGPAEMRSRRGMEREARLARVWGERHPIRFLASGGGWTLAAATLVGLMVSARILGAPAIVGGGLGLLSDSLGALWTNAEYGWRDLSTGFVGAADPFTLVLATLGTLTFWSPSFAIVVLWVIALPAASMAAWYAAARFTHRGGVRAFAAFVWAFAPTFLASLADGRPGAVLAHVLLPLLVLALMGAARSWASTAVASLLFAAISASAPSVAPVLLLGWIVVLLAAGRGIGRVLTIPLATLVLFAPLAVTQFLRGTPLGIFADPGFPVGGSRSTAQLLTMGFPTATGWDTVLSQLGIPFLSPSLLGAILIAPVLVMGLLALFLPGSRVALVSLVLAAAGLATSLVALQIQVATAGAERVSLWSGPGLSVYWLGLAGAAVSGLRALGRFGRPLTALTTVALLLLVAPLATNMVRGGVAVQPAPERSLPAYVAAEAKLSPRTTTLQISAQTSGGVRALLQRNSGATLDEQSTLAQTSTSLTDAQQQLADLTGNLVSASGRDPLPALIQFGVQFILVTPATGGTALQVAAHDDAVVAITQKSALSRVGETAYGTLWRVTAAVPPVGAPSDLHDPIGTLILWMDLGVLGATLLLAIPAGVGQETRPIRVRRRKEPADADGTAGARDDSADDAAIQTPLAHSEPRRAEPTELETPHD